MFKKALLLLALIILLFASTSCQTVQGVGGDVQWLGEKGAEVLE